MVSAAFVATTTHEVALDAVSESAPGVKEQPTEEVVYVTEPVPDPPVVVSLNGVP